MNRKDFVVVYTLKKEPDNFCCRACNIYRGPDTNGRCSDFRCVVTPYNNINHNLIATLKECFHNNCQLDITYVNQCVLKLKFNVKCPRITSYNPTRSQ